MAFWFRTVLKINMVDVLTDKAKLSGMDCYMLLNLANI